MTDPLGGIRFDYQDSVREFRRELDALGRDAFPRAMATLMNRATASVQSRLKAYTLTAVDKPNAFTKNAWFYIRAKWQDGDRMWSEVRAKDAQAQYLWFIVNGGTRKPGDIGTNRSAKDMFSFTAKLSTGDGIDRRYIRQLARKLKTEKKRRATYKAKRQAVIAENLPQDKQSKKLARLRWSVVSKTNPGIFIGTIHGVKGFWQRPERYTGEERQGLIDAARSRPSRPNTPSGTSNIGYTRAGSSAKLLVAMSLETKHQGSFDYDGEVNAAYAREMTQAAFDESLTYNRRRQRLINGGP